MKNSHTVMIKKMQFLKCTKRNKKVKWPRNVLYFYYKAQLKLIVNGFNALVIIRHIKINDTCVVFGLRYTAPIVKYVDVLNTNVWFL